MVQKKARRVKPTPPSESDSPVVSDDDGIDIGFTIDKASKQSFPSEMIESISDGEGENFLEQKHNNNINNGDESDSSSDGDVNPVGDIPMRWYDGYDHIGYNQSGEKINRQNKPSKLDLAADKSAWRRIYDEKNDEEIVITHEELKAIAHMRAGRFPGADMDTEENEFIAWSGAPMKHALVSGPEPKRRFLPSKHEAKMIVKLVRGFRNGTIRRPSEILRDMEKEDTPYQYDVWTGHETKTREEMTKSERARDIMKVPAPKPPLPTHAESYNPPEEYLPTEQEKKEWSDLDPEDREKNYLPTKHTALRHVPLYEDGVKERFERCLDLYLGVRIFKDQRKINPEDLIPELPSPKDLRPFPTDIVMSFGPLPSRARSIDVHPSGQFLLTGSDDGRVRLWEVGTGHLQCVWNMTKYVKRIDNLRPPVSCVKWSPKEDVFLFAASIGYEMVIMNAAHEMGVSTDETDIAMENKKEGEEDKEQMERMKEAGIEWSEQEFENEEDEDDKVEEDQDKFAGKCEMILIGHAKPLRHICWHKSGDYIGCVGRDGNGGMVALHRISHRRSQLPFKKKGGRVQAVQFHPTRPFFLVATMHNVQIFNLSIQQLVKTLKPGVSWISSIDIHPGGDNVLVTSYDKRLCWFDLDLSKRPYKTIRNHDKAIRIAKYHPRLPLFADASDDGSCHVFHGMVHDDLAKNALIVPLRKLDNKSKIVDSIGILDIAWHPRLPWLFTSAADGQVQMFTDCSQG